MDAKYLGKYRILRLLATGGMGEVFLARQEGPAGFAKPAVVKRILSHLAREPGFVEMFLAEARLAAMLNHPNIVQIFELGEADGAWYIAMEYVHGRSVRALRLAAQKKNERIDAVQAARIAAQALSGLHYAHHATGENNEPLNIVHRDISPDNVMVGFNGVVKVVDFGIAKAANAISTTATGAVKGKYAYMAPEQLSGGRLDGRADVYAMGVLLYELLAGARPFVASVETALINLVLNAEVPPLAERAPHAAPELCGLVMKALQKDPAQRWQTADEFANALVRYVGTTTQAYDNGLSGYLRAAFPDEAAENPAMTPPGEREAPLARARHLAPTVDDLPPVKDSPTPASRPGVPAPPVDAPPPARTDSRPGVRVPAVESPRQAAPTVDELSPVKARLQPAPRPPATVRWLLIGAAVALPAIGAVGVAVGRNSHQPGPSAVVSAPIAAEEEDAGAVEILRPLIDAGAQPAETAAAPDAGAAAAKRPAAPGRGKLELRVFPWGEVFENGRSLGVTPMAPLDLPAGLHSLVVKNSELKVSRTIDVRVPRGGTAQLKVDLSR